ncbi:hypothetical protein [uncultured Novosphingobium sp.]|uniref:hypothetical protein n=1 Tax=uncultured Novosphingobium sp. TaxID=292277 RepID=UPI002583F55C|nr:hypothetical protein [uncultured Novosphingobium sp.]
MSRILLLSPVAALLGSVFAVLFLGVRDLIVMSPQVGADEPIYGIYILLFGSLLFTVPAALVIGAPAIYVFRKELATYPWRWAPLVTFLGLVLGAICFGWLFRSSTSPYGLLLLLLFSGTTALSFSLLYGLTTRRLLKQGYQLF